MFNGTPQKRFGIKRFLDQNFFRRVEVTQADYTVLQELLKAQHPDRDEPDRITMAATNLMTPEYCLNVKLVFLRVAQPSRSFAFTYPDDDDDSKTKNKFSDSESSSEDDDDEVADSEPSGG